MKEIDRRIMLTQILCGAAVAAVGLAAMPKAAKAMPCGIYQGWSWETCGARRGR